jgi:hypothetical protein
MPSFAALRRLPRYPLEVFLWTRLLIWFGALVAYLLFEAQYALPVHVAGPTSAVQHDVGWAIDLWAKWDSGWFLQIAHHGYADPAQSSAFFPLYPALVWFLGYFLLGHDLLAGVLISLAASAAAFVLLWRLVCQLAGESTAGRTVLYLAIFPTTIFLFAVYSESLYLLLSVAAFLLAVRGRFGWAGVVTGLAALTRVSGVMLLPALAVFAWRAADRRAALLRLAVAVPIMALWPLYLGLAHGRPFVFLSAERAAWNRRLSDGGPLGGAWDALAVGWRGVRQLVAGSGHDYFPGASDAMYSAGLNLEQLAYGAVLIGLGIYAWRAFGTPYGIFVLGSLALPFSDPVPSSPLLSMPRFGLGVFPVFAALGALGARPRVNTALVATLAALLGINLARWVMWIWVA